MAKGILILHWPFFFPFLIHFFLLIIPIFPSPVAANDKKFFFWETYLGYGVSNIKQTGPSPNEEYGQMVGPGIGTRVGLKKFRLNFGLEYFYHQSRLDLEDGLAVEGYDIEIKGSELGVFVGLFLHNKPSFWLAYIPMARLDEVGSESDIGTWKGRGFKAGMGFKIKTRFHLNLEFKSIKYFEWTGQAGPDDQDPEKAQSQWAVTTLLAFLGFRF